MSSQGTHTSWYVRFQRVAQALRHAELHEDDLCWEWMEARRTMSAPDAYVRLVDRHL
eukprot:CAMPEP_0175440178 /NCGR_PEP_ID=MMETSP0095-20121207/56930_1 /TAXON_ID=311494 /ORGANISM="Alexandrium monilatum, Strain CCMP3105" /LENGTH=56 /DNA_ID=CAMNT_0016740031 /DNA_START=39 /DNA_END=206 /DNA_ORIENTATION=-